MVQIPTTSNFQKIIELGGNLETGKVTKDIITIVGNIYRVSFMTLNLWKGYVSNGNVGKTPRHTIGRHTLTRPYVHVDHMIKRVANYHWKKNAK